MARSMFSAEQISAERAEKCAVPSPLLMLQSWVTSENPCSHTYKPPSLLQHSFCSTSRFPSYIKPCCPSGREILHCCPSSNTLPPPCRIQRTAPLFLVLAPVFLIVQKPCLVQYLSFSLGLKRNLAPLLPFPRQWRDLFLARSWKTYQEFSVISLLCPCVTAWPWKNHLHPHLNVLKLHTVWVGGCRAAPTWHDPCGNRKRRGAMQKQLLNFSFRSKSLPAHLSRVGTRCHIWTTAKCFEICSAMQIDAVVSGPCIGIFPCSGCFYQ